MYIYFFCFMSTAPLAGPYQGEDDCIEVYSLQERFALRKFISMRGATKLGSVSCFRSVI